MLADLEPSCFLHLGIKNIRRVRLERGFALGLEQA